MNGRICAAFFSNIFVFTISILMGSAVIFEVIPSTAKNVDSSAYKLNDLVIIFTFGMWAWCWLYAMIADPGFVEEDLKRRGYYDDIKSGHVPPFLSSLPICSKCHMPMPLGATHCSDCNKCVLRQDHHCGVIGQCVADMNFKAFIQSFIYGAVMAAECSFYGFYNYFGTKSGTVVGLIVGGYGAVLTLMLTSFGVSFFWMGRTNRGTGKDKINMDVYMKSFGTKFWEFLIPIQRTSTNLAWPGIDWEINQPLQLL